MRKLIEVSQDILIKCDHCNYKVINKSKDINEPIEGYINKPCPECGKNLLTEADYKHSMILVNAINFANKWFSWLTIFKRKSKKLSKMEVNVHNGINFTKID